MEDIPEGRLIQNKKKRIMKLILSLATFAMLILLVSCSQPSNLEMAIEAFEERDGTNLEFDFKEVKLVNTITVLDSMKLLHYSAFTDSFSEDKNFIDTFYNSTLLVNLTNETQMAKYDSILASRASASTKKVYEKAKSDLAEYAEQSKKDLNRYSMLKKDYDRYLDADRDKILGKVYAAKFVLTNPETNKKEGKNRKYFFNADETKVLHIAK